LNERTSGRGSFHRKYSAASPWILAPQRRHGSLPRFVSTTSRTVRYRSRPDHFSGGRTDPNRSSFGSKCRSHGFAATASIERGSRSTGWAVEVEEKTTSASCRPAWRARAVTRISWEEVPTSKGRVG